MSIPHSYDESIAVSNESHKAASRFNQITNELWFDNSVELVLFRNPLTEITTGQLLQYLVYAEKMVEMPMSLNDMITIAQGIKALNLPPARIDIGKLTARFLKSNSSSVDEFLKSELDEIINHSHALIARDVVLYGFGRIGRILARELVRQFGSGKQLRLKAIVFRGNLTPQEMDRRANNLRYDSIHGFFDGQIECDYENQCFIINGVPIQLIAASSPAEIDYTKYGIHDAIVLDSTGAWRDDVTLAKHMEAKGVDKVLLTAPGKNMPNVVFGVNHTHFDISETKLWSAASCTTNAITPILDVINKEFGIDNGHLETIHAYTNDQNLVDNYHKGSRRGRAAALNMVITETGAGKAVSKAIPELAGKLTSNAIRVPVPNGSLVILNLRLGKETSVEEFNARIKKACLEGDYVEQITYSMSTEIVSSDIVGAWTPAVFDSPATQVGKDGKSVVLYVWYDNEYGYCRQVMKLAKYIAEVFRGSYY